MAKKASNESKHDLFLRLAKPRTQKVLDALRILGNCSNKNRYEYDIEEVEKIFGTITEYMSDVENKFNAVKLEQNKFDF